MAVNCSNRADHRKNPRVSSPVRHSSTGQRPNGDLGPFHGGCEAATILPVIIFLAAAEGSQSRSRRPVGGWQPRAQRPTEPFPTSCALVFDVLKDEDRGAQVGGALWTATQLGQ